MPIIKINKEIPKEFWDVLDDEIYVTKMPDSLRMSLLTYWKGISLGYKSEELRRETKKHLAGDIHEEYRIEHGKLPGQLKKDFDSTFISGLNEIINDQILEIKMDHLWVNYMKKTEHNPLHSHGGLFSFVAYLDVPEQIRQESKSQDKIANAISRGRIEFVSSTGGYKSLNPKTGDMFIFKSSQMHQVYPFYSDNVRISMSGNLLGLKRDV